VYGAIEKRLTLDYQIALLSSRGVDNLDLDTRNLLRLGLYQMAFLDRVPDHAAVNETVALASARTRGFVNAILRAFARNGKRLVYPDAGLEPLNYLSVRYSFATGLCAIFAETFGFARTESLFAAFCQPVPLTLRTNPVRTDRNALLSLLHGRGIAAEPTAESKTGVRITGAPVTTLPGFSEGLFFVQDEASQLCVEALDVRDGMTVLDVCACPGSKSFGIAADMHNTGHVIACDLHANKLSLVASGAKRLGLTNIVTEARDARVPRADWFGMADRVLCDVPCSGFGVFAKKPELRYKDPAASAALPEIQLAIAENASRYVKPGGLLEYSTCTLLPRENERNAERFAERHPEFTLQKMRTVYPDTERGMDGFFFAVFQKND
jgi:16S rRNA (cytosine967-C5)-methyltransferase